MARKNSEWKKLKPEKNSGDESDTRLIIVLVSAIILAILIIIAIAMTSFNLFY